MIGKNKDDMKLLTSCSVANLTFFISIIQVNTVPYLVSYQGAFLSSETVYLTTKDYYPRDEDIDCVFSSIQGSQLKIYIQYENRYVEVGNEG